MNKIMMVMLGLLLVVGLVSAHEHDGGEAEQLIDSGGSCDKLTDEQLEMIGEYYMEQMHPGEAHEMMDKMMGGEGSESLKQMHIQMAKRLYCDEDAGGMMGGGMMNMMIGSGGMMEMMPMMMNMGPGMIGNGMIGGSMRGGSWGLWNIVWVMFWITLLAALILLILWLYREITGKTTGKGSALDILKKRYAQGEFTKEQYESMKKELG